MDFEEKKSNKKRVTDISFLVSWKHEIWRVTVTSAQCTPCL